uniref:LITAF domain-containing protein n=1 Tax=Timema cristinae TaxID=61476 RepID=A0A7R9D4N8_TIMCR|nr:unnamed protein product [Timema cristinae]
MNTILSDYYLVLMTSVDKIPSWSQCEVSETRLHNIAAITVVNIFVMRRKEELRKQGEKGKKEASRRKAEKKDFDHDYPTSGKKSVFAFLAPPKKEKLEYKIGRTSERMTCPNCGCAIKTNTKHTMTMGTYVATILLIPLMLCWVPMTMKKFQNVRHYCPVCEAFLGVCPPGKNLDVRVVYSDDSGDGLYYWRLTAVVELSHLPVVSTTGVSQAMVESNRPSSGLYYWRLTAMVSKPPVSGESNDRSDA